jgi:DNA polymerase-4
MANEPIEYIGGRKIIHIDMDAFYASVEQRDNPNLRGKPIAVGGGSKRGVTTTASYEARKYGVKSAMPGWKAKELCPNLIFVKPRFEAYKEVSNRIRDIFFRYTDLVEPLSLDEAFLDVTQNKGEDPIATNIASEIKDSIFKETKLTASAGVSYNKFLAKIASDINKPNGLTVIKPHRAIEFIHELPIRKFFGIGKVTEQKMNKLGVYTGLDLSKMSKVDLIKNFGKSGGAYYKIVRGQDDSPVKPNRIRKSLAVERTFEENINQVENILAINDNLSRMLFERCERSKFFGKTLTLKLKNKEFVIKTRSITVKESLDTFDLICKTSKQLILNNEELCSEIRLMGLSISNTGSALDEKDKQLKLKF